MNQPVCPKLSRSLSCRRSPSPHFIGWHPPFSYASLCSDLLSLDLWSLGFKISHCSHGIIYISLIFPSVTSIIRWTLMSPNDEVSLKFRELHQKLAGSPKTGGSASLWDWTSKIWENLPLGLLTCPEGWTCSAPGWLRARLAAGFSWLSAHNWWREDGRGSCEMGNLPDSLWWVETPTFQAPSPSSWTSAPHSSSCPLSPALSSQQTFAQVWFLPICFPTLPSAPWPDKCSF